MLTNPLKFLERLENIDISKISIKVIAEIVKQRESVPDFENKIRAVSKAAASLVIWVKGVCDYHKIKNQK